jgi:2'-hydroxyisoflavone reductase
MRLLVLGGTKFLGRHLAALALEQGHEVTLFTRGQTNPELFPEAEHLRGDRDGDLGALAGREWDAVIDPSGYVPRVVRQSAELLRDAVGRYVFVSSVSVYADQSRGPSESSPTAELEDPASEDVSADYGALKAACEQVLDEVYGPRVAHVRAGLIVGPYDPTERFTYWPRRLAEGGDVLAPGEPGASVQFVDARDLGSFLLRLAKSDVSGALNATGPAEPMTMEQALTRIAAAVGGDCRFHWVESRTLEEDGVDPWMELPLWLGTDPDFAGMMQADISRALASGLELRPLEETARDTLAWARTVAPPRETLARERERELLAKHAGAGEPQ